MWEWNLNLWILALFFHARYSFGILLKYFSLQLLGTFPFALTFSLYILELSLRISYRFRLQICLNMSKDELIRLLMILLFIMLHNLLIHISLIHKWWSILFMLLKVALIWLVYVRLMLEKVIISEEFESWTAKAWSLRWD